MTLATNAELVALPNMSTYGSWMTEPCPEEFRGVAKVLRRFGGRRVRGDDRGWAYAGVLRGGSDFGVRDITLVMVDELAPYVVGSLTIVLWIDEGDAGAETFVVNGAREWTVEEQARMRNPTDAQAKPTVKRIGHVSVTEGGSKG